jgi:hypothetical protein
MKKILFTGAVLAAFLMTACGGEKKEEGKKEEKKEVSEETKKKFEELKTEWSNIDGSLTQIDALFTSFDDAKNQAYIDSLSPIAAKLKGESKDQAIALLDSLKSTNEYIRGMVTAYQSEKETWGTITEDFTQVNTEIEKGEASEDKIAPRAEGFTEMFNYKKQSVTDFNKQFDNWKKFDDQLKALINPTK